ncbi:MAG: IPExxxVDY family protein [Bacteroidales bacterium]|nr:IPExxxVDY family protein [Bacteroidales bacterium]MDP3001755.1 IPExxxVDY family protein [Bacteroidales bacterium]
MKSIQRITRLQLKINQNDEFILLGIVSAEPDYKLSLSINKKFRISLKNILPLKITDDTGSELAFSRFSDSSKSPDVVFNLFSNRSGKSFLLKKLKNVDYIFQVQDAENENHTDQITASLREIESVNAVFNIDINTFKDKNLQYLTQ